MELLFAIMELLSVILVFVFVFVYLSKKLNRYWKTTYSYGGQRGGRNIVYEEKLSDPRWKMKREKILDRDGHKCQWCGRTDRLQVHHKYYMKYPDGRFAEPWDYPDDKLITLCEDCHRKWHQKYPVKTYHRKWGVHYE